MCIQLMCISWGSDTRYLFENDGEGMPRLLLLLRYQTQYTLCIFTLIGSGVDERIRYRVRLTTALQLALPTNGIMDFHLHTFDGACDATICALRYDVYLPVKMLTHKVHTVKFLSAIIWSPGKYIWRFGLAINNYKCVSLHICNWQPDRKREESFKKKHTQKNNKRK